MWKFFCYFFAFSILIGCASSSKEAHDNLKSLIKKEKFKDAINYVQSSDFYPEESSKLLKLLELGVNLHLANDYYNSLKTFEKAKELSDKLFTKSISKKIKTFLVNNNSDNYYGEKYEQSLIFYYLVLNHFLIYQEGKYTNPQKNLSPKEKRFHLKSARSLLIAWDSFLDNFQSLSAGEVTYKDDLVAKVFGAVIHEHFNTRKDRRIALDLYREAKKILFRNYNALKPFNERAQKFKDNYKKLPNISEKKVKSDYTKSTANYDQLYLFLEKQIKRLKKNKRNNLFVLLENDFITAKRAKKHEFPLPFNHAPLTVRNNQNFLSFTVRTLGGLPGIPPTIYFELPEIPYKAHDDQFYILAKEKVSGKTIREPLSLLNPMSALANLIYENKISAIKTKVGVRVAVKHLTALSSAYVIYQNQKNKGDFIAMALAAASYSLANRGIKASEKADLRNWATLPHSFMTANIELRPGSYHLSILNKNLKEVKSFGVREIGKKPLFLKARTY